MHRLSTQPVQALVHDSTSLGELWHQRLAHLHYRALPSLRVMVTRLLALNVDRDGVCRGCVLGKNTKRSFPSSENISKGNLDLVHSDLCGPMKVASLGVYYY